MNKIDELGFINEQIKALTARKQELSDAVSNEYDTGVNLGSEFIAEIKLLQRETINGSKLAESLSLPAEVVNKFKKTTAYISVSTKRISK
jgi:predicted phage-related endonuclease